MKILHDEYPSPPPLLATVVQRWRAWLSIWISGFDSLHTLTGCGSFDDKEVKDVFGRPGARVSVEVGWAR